MVGVLPASAEIYLQFHAEAERLSHLVDDLQELSSVEFSAVQLKIHPVDSTALIQTVSKRIQYQFDENQFTLTLSMPREPILVLADED